LARLKKTLIYKGKTSGMGQMKKTEGFFFCFFVA
jgi:hypothetical protein